MSRTIRGIRVEFQPDFQKPREPIPLGIVVHAVLGQKRNFVALLGKRPKQTKSRGWQGISGLGYELVAGWVDAFRKDIAEAVPRDPLEYLCLRWYSNLYVTSPVEVSAPKKGESLENVVLKFYKENMGESFPKEAIRPFAFPTEAKTAKKRPLRHRHDYEPVAQMVASA